MGDGEFLEYSFFPTKVLARIICENASVGLRVSVTSLFVGDRDEDGDEVRLKVSICDGDEDGDEVRLRVSVTSLFVGEGEGRGEGKK